MNTSNKHVRIEGQEGDEVEEDLENADTSKEEEPIDFNLPEDQRCWVCKKRKIAFQPLDCDCAVYCKTCAMKLATSFYCKGCHQMSSGMRRVRR